MIVPNLFRSIQHQSSSLKKSIHYPLCIIRISFYHITHHNHYHPVIRDQHVYILTVLHSHHDFVYHCHFYFQTHREFLIANITQRHYIIFASNCIWIATPLQKKCLQYLPLLKISLHSTFLLIYIHIQI